MRPAVLSTADGPRERDDVGTDGRRPGAQLWPRRSRGRSGRVDVVDEADSLAASPRARNAAWTFARRSARVSPRWGLTRPGSRRARATGSPQPTAERRESSSAGFAPRQPTRSPSPGTNASTSTCGRRHRLGDEVGGTRRRRAQMPRSFHADERAGGAVVGDRGPGGGEGEPPSGALPAPLHRPGGRQPQRAQSVPRSTSSPPAAAAAEQLLAEPAGEASFRQQSTRGAARPTSIPLDSGAAARRTVPASCRVQFVRATRRPPVSAER